MANRFDFVKYSPEAVALNEDLTANAKVLEYVLDRLPNGREKALALTKLEESIMWARKALRDVGQHGGTEPVSKA